MGTKLRWVALVLILIIGLSSCAQPQQNSSKQEQTGSTPQTTTSLPTQPSTTPTKQTEVAIPSSYRLNVPHVYAGLADKERHNSCSTGSFASLAEYQKPDLDISDIVALSGMGTYVDYHTPPAGSNMPVHFFNLNPTQEFIDLSINLNTPIFVGVQAGGSLEEKSAPDAPFSVKSFNMQAQKIMSFSNGDEALNSLKQAIASNHPVVVYLDNYYLQDDFKLVSENWKQKEPIKPGATWAIATFFAVTGYDENYIYVNDPGDPEGKDLPAKIENFKLAWQNTGTSNPPVSVSPYGPYWMMYIGDIGTISSFQQTIAFNINLANYSLPKLRQFIENPSFDSGIDQGYDHMAVVRVGFGDYLEKHGMDQIGEDYIKSGYLFDDMTVKGTSDVGDLNSIADLEASALEMMKEIK